MKPLKFIRSANELVKSKIIVSILLIFLTSFSSFSQSSKTFIKGSYIINMGLHSGTYATDVNKELKPWGLVYELLKVYNVPVYVIINPTKGKDGIDFTYNSRNYKGGTFIIDVKNISSAVASRIATNWSTVDIDTVTTSLTLDVAFRYTVVPKWSLNTDNQTIASGFFANAGIPSTAYDSKTPNQLDACSDIFVMPHADPTWTDHGSLLTWNLTNKGAIWTGCHAGSALHNTYNPIDTSKQMNFLTTRNQAVYSSSATNTGKVITVGSTSSLAVGMIVKVTSGTGAFAAGTTIKTINTGTTFTVSANVATNLSGAVVSVYSADIIFPVVSNVNAGNSANFCQNSLVLWTNHDKGLSAVPPYNTCTGSVTNGTLVNAADPVAQYMGLTDIAHTDGSEQSYLPLLGQKWLPSTKIICYNPSPNYPSTLSSGPEVLIAYGRGFGDANRGYVMMEAGHDLDKNNNAGAVAAQRAFFNWSFLAVQDKAIIISGITGLPSNGIVNATNSYNLSVNYTSSAVFNTNLTFTWSCIQTSNGVSIGTFTPNGTNAASSTTFQPGIVTVPTDAVIQVTIIDACGRKTFESYPVTIVPKVVTISGTVWFDADSSANHTFTNIQNGSEAGTNTHPISPNALYVYCIDANGFIIAVGTVNANGTYTLNNIPTLTTGLSLVVSNIGSDIGNLAPSTSIPLGWINTTPLIRDNISTMLGNNITGMDWGVYLQESGGITPVTLTSFTAALKNSRQSLLNWNTQAELKTSHYDIERSINGLNFEKRGSTNSIINSVNNQYQYTDDLNTTSELFYYRLKIVDNDNTFKYSNIVPLRINGNAYGDGMLVYPNPFTSDFKIEINSESIQIGLIKLNAIDGRLIKDIKYPLSKGKNIIVMQNLQDVVPGTYILEVQTSNKKDIKKIMKN